MAKQGDCEFKPPQRFERKRDLSMFLALHMENSPHCDNTENEFFKTGIVVCESDKVHKIMTMCCSTKDLHAVQKVMLNTSVSLRRSCVYLSRKPCSTCTKFLIQGEVSSVSFWPRCPELKGNDDFVKEDLKEVDDLFLRSSTISSVFVPFIEHWNREDVASAISKRTNLYKCKTCEREPYYSKSLQGEDIKRGCDLLNLHDCTEACRSQMKDAFQCLDALLHCPHGTFEEAEPNMEKEHTHALQLCYLLASRSDDPHKGVGCVLYNGNGYFFGAGYNGYPIGALYGNLPRRGRAYQKRITKKQALVHAEANALLFRFKKKIEDNDILYCSKPPCSECENYIAFVGIKMIVTVKESTKPSDKGEKVHVDALNIKNNLKYLQWKPPEEALKSNQEKNSEERENGESEDSTSHIEEPKEKTFTSARLPKKSDLCMFLALHMENSPFCKKPMKSNGFEFHATGIVICEGDHFQRIIAMDYSTETLHAVQKALLRLPNQLRGCKAYLSRKPCIDCVKFLVQAQISYVYFWSNFEVETKISAPNFPAIEKQNKLINIILKESCTYDALFLPILDPERVKDIAARINVKKSCRVSITSEFDKETDFKILDQLNVPHLKECEDPFREEVDKAKESFRILVGAEDMSVMQNNFEEKCEYETKDYIQHALQLCNLLAARSDAFDEAVGTVIYKENNIVAAGYGGFPRGTMNNLYIKRNYCSDRRRVICAEANALILRLEDNLSGAELITIKEPCHECTRLIKEKGIKRIIWPVRKKETAGVQSCPESAQIPPETDHTKQLPTEDASENN